MKSKYLLSVIIVASIIASAFIRPGGVVDSSVMKTGAKVSCISDASAGCTAILCEPDINFSAGIVKISHHDTGKTYEKHFKHKLPVKENLKIEYFVEKYIFYTESLTSRLSELCRLRRLNI